MKIGILGGGNIAKAIVCGLIKSNESLIKWNNEKFSASTDWSTLKSCEIIILALLPQDIYKLKNKLKNNFTNKIIISIASGIKISNLKLIFNQCNIARIMTNTSCQFNQAMIMICSESDEIAKSKTKEIFKSCGTLIQLSEEKIDYFIAIYGSAPAYIYYWLQPLLDKALEANINLKETKSILISLLLGAANTILNSELSLQQLINNICVPGGTTIAAINIFEQEKVKNIITKSLNNCIEHSKQLENDS